MAPARGGFTNCARLEARDRLINWNREFMVHREAVLCFIFVYRTLPRSTGVWTPHIPRKGWSLIRLPWLVATAKRSTVNRYLDDCGANSSNACGPCCSPC
jgi:hypothetical protein